MVAPVALARRLLSVFFSLRRAVTPACVQVHDTGLIQGLRKQATYFDEIMLSQIIEALFGYNEIRFEFKNIRNHLLDRFLLLLKDLPHNERNS